ncbi:30S ribosomal protein S3 [Candidatus Woesearchaeota archaeon]|nr:30S ribosomal protein S3 [Candidatus Woesearchaeota archaeon]
MIENKFLKENLKAFEIKEFIMSTMRHAGISDVKLQKTPLGERIIVRTSRPGLVVGRGGSNISKLTEEVKQRFNLENPQIEIEEVTNPYLEPEIVADMIATTFELYGTGGFKGVGHRAIQDIMRNGAIGAEIFISGKVPSQRAKTWRFYAGYMKKCGDLAITGVRKAIKVAKLKSGVVGIKVSILPPDVKLPDNINIKQAQQVAQPGIEQVGQDQELEKAMSNAENEKNETNAKLESNAKAEANADIKPSEAKTRAVKPENTN